MGIIVGIRDVDSKRETCAVLMQLSRVEHIILIQVLHDLIVVIEEENVRVVTLWIVILSKGVLLNYLLVDIEE